MSTVPHARGGVLIALGLLISWAGCGTGSVDIVLQMPSKAELAPAGAATVTLVAEQPGETPKATTSVISDDGSFDLGKLPVVDGLSLSVVLRSSTQRVVGYGRALTAVDITARDQLEVDMPVRRPFAYVTGASGGLVALDTTLDSTQKYQSMIGVSGGATIAAASGGDVWAIAGSGHAARVSGSTHAPDGATVNLASGVNDAIATSDGRWLIGATTSGFSIAEVASGKVTQVNVAGGVDRVAIGATVAGGVRAVGLIGRVSPDDCKTAPPTSKIAIVEIGDTIGDANVQDPKVPLSDVAGSETSIDLVGADPCNDSLLRLTVGGEISTATKLASVPAPSAAAMFGDHAWALGSIPGTADSGMVIIDAAHLVLVDAAVDGSGSQRADLPPVRQVTHGYDSGGNDLVLSRDINAGTVSATDLVVVPPGDQIAVVYHAKFWAPELDQGFQVVIPEMTVDTSEYELLSATGGAVVQRMLANCGLVYDGIGAAVPIWMCGPAPGAAAPIGGAFTPGNLAVLYGGR
ncbi:MAG TPA: hypothetical protein VL463_02040 [Kofleriaceae bacterium]|nr:hypothetical protein [Kofleriaceae bacterium]